MSQVSSLLGLAASVVVVCFAALAPAAEKAIPQNEKAVAAKEVSPADAAVRKVVEQHIQGIVKADAALLEECWDTKAGRITFVSHDKEGKEIVQTGPITESFKLWTAAKLPGTKGAIQNVDVVNDKMALVKARIVWKRQVFDDYLVLLNTDGQWRLVSKTYSSGKAASPYGAP